MKTIGALLIILLGLLTMWTPFIKITTKWRNEIRGIPTNITQTTINFQRIMGALIILLGLGMLFGFL